MKISIIVAMDGKRGIGKDNGLLFQIPADLKRFRSLTRGHPVIMGRRTFESEEIKGRPLPKRINIIVTREKKYNPHKFCICENCDVFIASSLEEAIEIAKEKEKKEIFIIGGGQIYKQAMPFVDKLYLTIVEGDYGADTFFPDYSEFKKVVFEEKRESEGYKYKFLELER